MQKYGDRYGEWWEDSEEKMVANGPLIVDFPRFALRKELWRAMPRWAEGQLRKNLGIMKTGLGGLGSAVRSAA